MPATSAQARLYDFMKSEIPTSNQGGSNYLTIAFAAVYQKENYNYECEKCEI